MAIWADLRGKLLICIQNVIVVHIIVIFCSAVPNKLGRWAGGGGLAKFEEKVPPQDVYSVLAMYCNC